MKTGFYYTCTDLLFNTNIVIHLVPINYLAVLVCGVASMVIGSLWFGPLFGKPWMAMMGWDASKKEAWAKTPGAKSKMAKLYAIQFVASLVMACVLAHVLVFAGTYMKSSGVSAGLSAGFWSWLGFVAPVTLGMVLWEGKPWKLWTIVAGSHLVTLCTMGVILALWK